MQPYQNYYPNNQMPMYSQGYNPMMNAQQRLAQMEQQYPQLAQQNYMQPTQMSGANQQQFGLNGRFVDDFNTLSANDVPMDGNGAIFIKKDGSEIQLRNWTALGAIQTTSYKPILDAKNENTDKLPSESKETHIGAFSAFTEEIMKRFDEIDMQLSNFDKQLSSFDKKLSTAKQASRAKKEDDAE